MSGPFHTRSFKSGNSVAVRLPKVLGIGPDESFAISRQGDVVTARRIPTVEEEAARLARFRAGLAALKALPPSPEVEEREPIDFPDRPGL
jgi:antitoxin VapB